MCNRKKKLLNIPLSTTLKLRAFLKARGKVSHPYKKQVKL
jgi:hypothetical protein